MEQLEDNPVATAVEITKEDRERLDEGAPPGRTTMQPTTKQRLRSAQVSLVRRGHHITGKGHNLCRG
jgi:hypothetical protein